MNQANKGEPFSSGKMSLDIAKDMVSDGMGSSVAPKASETTKGAISNVISGTFDVGMEMTPATKTPVRTAQITINPLSLLEDKSDATMRHVIIPNFRP
jgi:hypothetical protein